MSRTIDIHNACNRINPIKVIYSIMEKYTTIYYEEKHFKWLEKSISFKGKYFDKVRPTIFNIVEKILIESGKL